MDGWVKSDTIPEGFSDDRKHHVWLVRELLESEEVCFIREFGTQEDARRERNVLASIIARSDEYKGKVGLRQRGCVLVVYKLDS